MTEALTSVGRKHTDVPLDLPFSMGDEQELAAMIEAAGFTDSADVIARYRDGNGVKFPVRANMVTARAG